MGSAKKGAIAFERLHIKPAAKSGDGQPANIFRARTKKGYLVAVSWGGNDHQVVYVPEKDWEVQTEDEHLEENAKAKAVKEVDAKK